MRGLLGNLLREGQSFLHGHRSLRSGSCANSSGRIQCDIASELHVARTPDFAHAARTESGLYVVEPEASGGVYRHKLLAERRDLTQNTTPLLVSSRDVRVRHEH